MPPKASNTAGSKMYANAKSSHAELKPYRLLGRSKDVMVVASGFIAQFGKLVKMERHIWGRFSAPAYDNYRGDRLLYFDPTSDYIWRTSTFVMESRISSRGAILRFHSVGLQLITLPSATEGVYKLNGVVYSGPHPWNPIVPRSPFDWVCP